MRILTRSICILFLAVFVLSISIAAADCPRGYVMYRQTFNELTYPDTAGIVKGADGEDGFDLTINNDALCIDSFDARKSYVIFPCILPEPDHTVEYTFSFSKLETTNAYVGFMLTSKGDAPDNITSVVVRANGNVDGFGKLSESMTAKIASGEKITVSIPVENGVFHKITLKCGGEVETVVSESITDISEGRIGFVTRNASVLVHEVAVVNGVDYKAKTGILKNDSSWNDTNPYTSGNKMARIMPCYEFDNEGVPAAPQTFDPMGIAVAALCFSAAGAVSLFKKKR